MNNGPKEVNHQTATGNPADRPPFTEAEAWKAIGQGWRPLHGGFHDQGYSVEWHDFETEREIDWSRSFHPRSVEICLNLSGCGSVRTGGNNVDFGPSTAGFYFQSGRGLGATRAGKQRHTFLTLELSLPFLQRHLNAAEDGLHPLLATLLKPGRRLPAAVSEAAPLTVEQQQLILTLRRPTVSAAGRPLWYQAKTLEVASVLFFPRAAEDELFCARQARLSRERALKVVAILKENLEEPPPLEEIGRRVGCSHFHLSRLFTKEMGATISVYLRGLRMERAAALLREGRMNVTEVSLAVGYSSLSHFSATFHQTHGCCPGLYPLKTLPQRLAGTTRS